MESISIRDTPLDLFINVSRDICIDYKNNMPID